MTQLFLTEFNNQSALEEFQNSTETERLEASVKDKPLIGAGGGMDVERMWARGSKRLKEWWDTGGVMYV